MGKLSDHSAAGGERSPVTGEYDVAPFREAFERSGMSLSELARKLGWCRPDQPRAGQTLGIHRTHQGGRRRGYRERVTHDTAVKLAEALDVDPVDVGL